MTIIIFPRHAVLRGCSQLHVLYDDIGQETVVQSQADVGRVFVVAGGDRGTDMCSVVGKLVAFLNEIKIKLTIQPYCRLLCIPS